MLGSPEFLEEDEDLEFASPDAQGIATSLQPSPQTEGIMTQPESSISQFQSQIVTGGLALSPPTSGSRDTYG